MIELNVSFIPDGQEFIHLSCPCPPRICLRKQANTERFKGYILYVDEFQQSVMRTQRSNVSDDPNSLSWGHNVLMSVTNPNSLSWGHNVLMSVTSPNNMSCRHRLAHKVSVCVHNTGKFTYLVTNVTFIKNNKNSLYKE